MDERRINYNGRTNAVNCYRLFVKIKIGTNNFLFVGIEQ